MKKLALSVFLLASYLSAQVSLGTGVQIGGGSANSNPLDVNQIAQSGELVSTYQESLFGATNSTVTLADIKGVSGTIVGMAVGYCPGTSSCSGAGNTGPAILNFYYDGNVGTPDMAFSTSDIGNSWQASNTTFQSQRISSLIANSTSGQGGFQFNFPMYFSSEWRLTASVPASETNGETFWITVWYTTASTSALRLHAATARSASVNLTTTNYTFLNVSGSGIIAGISFIVIPGSQSDFTYSEGNVQTYLDGATTIGQAIPAGGSSGTGCSVGDTFTVVQGGASGGEVMALAVSSGAVTALTPVLTSLGTGYSTASGLSTTAVSSTCSATPTVYISTAQNSNDSIESYLSQSLEFGITSTRQSNFGFVSAYAASGNTHGYTVFYDILDQQKGNRFNSAAQVLWQPDPVKKALITNAAVSFDYVMWYYQ